MIAVFHDLLRKGIHGPLCPSSTCPFSPECPLQYLLTFMQTENVHLLTCLALKSLEGNVSTTEWQRVLTPCQ